MSVSVSADEPVYTPSDQLSYEVYENAVAITGCSEYTFNLVIPPYIDGKPVTVIAPGAFSGRALLTAVVPDTVIAIGQGAFGKR